MVYKFREGCRLNGAMAQTAGEMCEELAKEGQLTPGNLLDANREEDAPLHDMFEWDDGKAAEKYREGQARHIIQCIVTCPVEDMEPTRAFVRVTNATKKYTPIEVVIREPDMMAALEEQAWKEMGIFTRKYKNIQKLSGLIGEMEDLLAEGR